MKISGPSFMIRNLTTRNITVNAASTMALFRNPLIHCGRFCGSTKKDLSSPIPERRSICTGLKQPNKQPGSNASHKYEQQENPSYFVEYKEVVSQAHCYNSDPLLLAECRAQAAHQHHYKPHTTCRLGMTGK